MSGEIFRLSDLWRTARAISGFGRRRLGFGLEYTEVAFEAQQTVNLKAGTSDKKDHYALFDGFSIGVNKEADDYDDFKTDKITGYQSTITDIIRSVMQSHNNDDITEDLIKKESLEQIQERFGTKSIVELTLKNFMHQ